MRVTIFGTGYVGLVTGTCWPRSATTCSASTSTQAKVEGLKRGVIPIFEPGLEAMVKSQPRRRPAALHHRRRRGGRARRDRCSSPSARRPTRTARPTCSTCWRWPRPSASTWSEPEVVVDKSTVPVGTADKVRATIADDAGRARRRRRASTSSPTRSSSRKAPRSPTACAPTASSSAPTARGSEELLRELYAPFNRNHDKHHRDGRALGRADQVRRQLHAGDQDQLHERDGQPRRAASAPTSRWCARASARTRASATTSSIPAPATAARASPRTCRR